jgi:hypothetical protein
MRCRVCLKILYSNLSRILQKSAPASHSISIDASKSCRPFDCSNDEERSEETVKKLEDGATVNDGGNQKAIAKKVNSSRSATQISPDNRELENDFSAHVGGGTTEEIKGLGGNTQTIDAMNVSLIHFK